MKTVLWTTLLAACGGPATDGAPPAPEPIVLPTSPVDDGCANEDLVKLTESVKNGSGSMRINLLSLFRQPELCGAFVGPTMASWVRRWSFDGWKPKRPKPLADDVNKAIDAERLLWCPGGDALWTLPVGSSAEALNKTFDTCDLGRYRLLDATSVQASRSPESAVLGSALYAMLMEGGRDPVASRQIAEWVAGTDVDHTVLMGTYGDIAAATNGLVIPVGQGKDRFQERGCEPIVAVAADGAIRLDGKSVSLDEVGAAAACKHRRPTLPVAVDAKTPFSVVHPVLLATQVRGRIVQPLLSGQADVQFTTPVRYVYISVEGAGEPRPGRLVVSVAGQTAGMVFEGAEVGRVDVSDAAALVEAFNTFTKANPNVSDLQIDVSATVEWGALMGVVNAATTGSTPLFTAVRPATK